MESMSAFDIEHLSVHPLVLKMVVSVFRGWLDFSLVRNYIYASHHAFHFSAVLFLIITKYRYNWFMNILII